MTISADHARLQTKQAVKEMRLERVHSLLKLRASEEWRAYEAEVEDYILQKLAAFIQEDPELRTALALIGIGSRSPEEADLLKRQLTHLRGVLKRRQDQNFHLDLGRPKVPVAEEGVRT